MAATPEPPNQSPVRLAVAGRAPYCPGEEFTSIYVEDLLVNSLASERNARRARQPADRGCNVTGCGAPRATSRAAARRIGDHPAGMPVVRPLHRPLYVWILICFSAITVPAFCSSFFDIVFTLLFVSPKNALADT